MHADREGLDQDGPSVHRILRRFSIRVEPQAAPDVRIVIKRAVNHAEVDTGDAHHCHAKRSGRQPRTGTALNKRHTRTHARDKKIIRAASGGVELDRDFERLGERAKGGERELDYTG